MHIIEHPCVPFETPIYEGMEHNSKVEIHGEAHMGHHNGFVVEFPSMEGIALHMSVRMNECGEHVVILNSARHGHWECEERHHNPFHCGHHFHLKIKNHHGHYGIDVNGHHLAHFHHRESPHHIRALVIRGDVRVEKIHFDHFRHHNGGGVEFGGHGGMMMAPPPPMMVAPPPMAPPPMIYGAPMRGPEVVVIEEDHHHHHHHRHGLLHRLTHHHRHHCD